MPSSSPARWRARSPEPSSNERGRRHRRGPWGATLAAILAMAAATYLCRISGFVLMSRIAITPRVDGR